MKILIATGIYPPEIGGPAQYAFNLNKEFKKLGHESFAVFYGKIKLFPSGIRHFLYFCKILPKILRSDTVIILDTFSAALPALIASKIFGKKTILRTGGDFLWEGYVERTGDMVLLREFYGTSMKMPTKEKILFKIIKWILHNCDAVVFSTRWQLNIFSPAYDLNARKLFIVENYYGEKENYEKNTPVKKIFVAGVRKLKWKNLETLKKAFSLASQKNDEIVLDEENVDYKAFQDKIKASYAVILASLGDISPNMILDAIRLNKPFIITRENGLNDRIGGIGLAVDPRSPEDIAQKILMFADDKIYNEYKNRTIEFDFKHSWKEIAQEFLSISEKL